VLGQAEVRRTSGLGFVLTVYALSRILYLVSGSVLAGVVPAGDVQRVSSDVPRGSMNIWSHWDGEHYVSLALGGYLQAPDHASPAFFPMYPLLLRSLSELFGGPASRESLSLLGTLVSLLLLPFAFYFIYDIALQGWGRGVARRTILAIAFFPTSFFLNAAYTESLFLALSAGSLWAMRVKRDLLLACVLAGFAAATRNVGVFLVVPLVYEWIKAGGLNEPGERWRGVYLGLAPSGLIIYMGYLWAKFGNPVLFYSGQKNWGREATGPLTTATRAWQSAVKGATRLQDPGLWAEPSLQNLANHFADARGLYDLALFVLAVVVLLASVGKLPPSLTMYGFLLVAPATLFGTPDTPLMGTSRYLLVAFPVFIGLALLSRRKLLFGLWLIISAAMSLIMCGLFVSWWYVA